MFASIYIVRGNLGAKPLHKWLVEMMISCQPYWILDIDIDIDIGDALGIQETPYMLVGNTEIV